eukprot:m.285156 g.285156  ORF g.285156 m.285156 type:complete len:369 (+) comp19430_c6_seq9:3-1109(+)
MFAFTCFVVSFFSCVCLALSAQPDTYLNTCTDDNHLPPTDTMGDEGKVTKKARTGAEWSLVGLGTWKSKPGQVEAAVEHALESGYRHIDCAAVYGNEKEVGAALKKVFDKGVIKREDVWITSKLWNTKHAKEDVRPALVKTLEDLGLEYLDLYLIHWPHGFQAGDNPFPKDEQGNVLYSYTPLMETWTAMEAVYEEGLVRNIGLSNFNSKQIQEIVDGGKVKPFALQVEVHPYLTQNKLIEFCKALDIKVTAYSPLGSPDRPWAKPGEPSLLEDPKLKEIGDKYGKTPAQVAIRFQVDRGVAVIPKSVTPSRIEQNFNVFDFKLTDEDIATIESFNRPWRACVPMVEVDGKPVERDAKHPLYPFNEEF